MSEDAVETLKMLLVSSIRANDHHETLRGRLRRALERQYLTLNDAYRSLDPHDRGFLSGYDLQDLIAENRRSCQAAELV